MCTCESQLGEEGGEMLRTTEVLLSEISISCYHTDIHGLELQEATVRVSQAPVSKAGEEVGALASTSAGQPEMKQPAAYQLV